MGTQASTPGQPPPKSATEKSMAVPLVVPPNEVVPPESEELPAGTEGAGPPSPPEPTDAGAVPGAGEGAAPPEEAAPAEGEEAQPTGYDQLLPWEAADTYPTELIALAGQKFGIDQQLIDSTPSVRDLVISGINKDILIRNSQYEKDVLAAGEEETEEGQEEPAPTDQPPTGEAAGAGLTQILASARKVAEQQVTAEGAKVYFDSISRDQQDLNQAYKSKDPVRIEGAQRNALASQMALVNMAVNEALRDQFPVHFDAEVGKLHTSTTQWTKARTLAAKDPRYGKHIQSLFTSGRFDSVLDELPGLEKAQFTGPDGKPLNPVANKARMYLAAARFILGENPQVATDVVQRAQQSGQRAGAEGARRAGLGRTGMGGRSTGAIQGGKSDDDFMAGLVAADQRQNPMRTLARKTGVS